MVYRLNFRSCIRSRLGSSFFLRPHGSECASKVGCRTVGVGRALRHGISRAGVANSIGSFLVGALVGHLDRRAEGRPDGRGVAVQVAWPRCDSGDADACCTRRRTPPWLTATSIAKFRGHVPIWDRGVLARPACSECYLCEVGLVASVSSAARSSHSKRTNPEVHDFLVAGGKREHSRAWATDSRPEAYLLHVKGQFHALAKLLPDPLEHLAQLPSDPLTLLRDHGAMFHNVFAEKATPVAPRIQLGDVLEFNHSYGCRGGGRHTVPATAQLALGMPDTAVQQVADVMASQQRMIEQMLAHSAGSQHSGYRHPKAFDLMMMGGGHSSGSGRLAQLLDAPSTAAMSVVPVLGNSPPAVQQQLQPQIQVQPQLQQLQLQPQLQLRSQPPVQQQVVPPRPSQGQLQLQPPVQPQVQVQPPVQQQVVSSQPSQGQPAADFLTDMLDTLAERDGERKAEAKRVKLGASAAKPVATNTRLRKKTSVDTDGEGDDEAAVHSGGRVRKAAVHSGGDHGKGAAIAKALEAYTNYTQLVQRGMQYKGKHFNSNILAAVR
jgi:hypothetical protein